MGIMLASELIKLLQDEINENGDIPVMINTMDEEGDEIWNLILKVDTCVSLEKGEVKPECIRIMDYYD